MADPTQQHILNAMQAGGIVNNRTNAVAALTKVGVAENVEFTLAACCAMLLQETAGMNYWGHDPWDSAAYPRGIAREARAGETLVTQAAYTSYKMLRNEGYQPQGVGPCQLTWTAFQVEAEKAGGCWQPYPNMLVGFQILKSFFLEGGSAFQGFWYWNGRTSAGQQYAYAAVSSMNHFQALFNA